MQTGHLTLTATQYKQGNSTIHPHNIIKDTSTIQPQNTNRILQQYSHTIYTGSLNHAATNYNHTIF